MSSYSIDINADVGEGLDNEKDLMPYLSSCNIACGGHAGDSQTMAHVVRLAKVQGVKIGAHPSFPDKTNFGRTVLDMTATDLYASLKQQVRALQQVLYAENAQLHHIKPHGALYNLASKDERTANVVVEVIKSIAMPIQLYAPYNSVLAKRAKSESISVVYEAFADRNYNDDLSLVSRKKEKAILNNKHDVLSHLIEMILHQNVTTIQGEKIEIIASTFCVHGDTKNALQILKFLTEELPKNKIKIQ